MCNHAPLALALSFTLAGCTPGIGPTAAIPKPRPTVDQFDVTGWRVAPDDDGRGSLITGEVKNNGEMPASVELCVTVRGPGGQVVESKSWWWGTGNILAGQSASFRTHIASPPDANIELWLARAVDWENPQL